MTSLAMKRMMNVAASTKRAAVTSGKRGTPTTYLSSIKILPIDPIGMAETRNRVQALGLDAPILLLQTVTSGANDIVKGDVLTVASVDYAIKDVEDWAGETGAGGQQYLRLVLEKVKP